MFSDRTLCLKHRHYDVVIENDETYTAKSVDNNRSYDIEYSFSKHTEYPSSRHSITVKHVERVLQSCILLADGGFSSIHEHSALIHNDSCVIAVGSFLCSLQVPTLELQWQVEVDTATCFGVYYSTKYDCLISHGELEIARIECDGSILWQTSGADIFTNGFQLHENHIEVVDFYSRKYDISIDAGELR